MAVAVVTAGAGWRRGGVMREGPRPCLPLAVMILAVAAAAVVAASVAGASEVVTSAAVAAAARLTVTARTCACSMRTLLPRTRRYKLPRPRGMEPVAFGASLKTPSLATRRENGR